MEGILQECWDLGILLQTYIVLTGFQVHETGLIIICGSYHTAATGLFFYVCIYSDDIMNAPRPSQE